MSGVLSSVLPIFSVHTILLPQKEKVERRLELIRVLSLVE